MAAENYSLPVRTVVATTTNTKISGTGTPPTNSTVVRDTNVRSGSYSASETKDWKKIRNTGGLLPMNSYCRWDHTYDRPVGFYSGTNKGPNPKYSTITVGPQAASDGAVALAGKSLEGCIAKIGSMSQNINIRALQQEAYADIAPQLDALTTLSEAHKTVKMVLGIRKSALALLREGLKGGWSTAKAAASARLEWRYGWRILGYDIQNFVDYWKEPWTYEIALGHSAPLEIVENEIENQSTYGGYYCQWTDVCTIKRKLSVYASAGIRYDTRYVNVMVSPVNTLWELIPFSFVADWIVNVGTTLAASRAASSAVAQTSCVNYLFEEESRAVPTNIALGPGANAVSPYGVSYVNTSKSSLRMRVPLGRLHYTPQLNVKLDQGKLLDAAALLTNFKKDLRK